MTGEASLTVCLPVLGSLACKSLLVFAAAAAALWGLRRASASLRHLVCLLTLVALLALPTLSLTLPGWRLTVPLLAPPALSPAPVPQSPGVPIPAHKFATLPSEGSEMKPGEPAMTGVAPFLTLPSEGRDRPRTNVNGPGIGSGGSWPVLLPALWLGGLILTGLRPLLGLWGIAGLSRLSVLVTDTDALALVDECAAALHLTAAPALRQADAPVPMTWGGRHPVVLLPLEAQTWPEDRLRAVLLHEMAHVRRRDWLSHRFADFVCALYWFHPFVWLTAWRLRAESEIACDDLVLASGLAAPDYARHLLDVARALRPLSHVPRAAIAMARTTHIEGRLKMILNPAQSRQALTRRALLFVVTLGSAALILLAVLRPAAKAQNVPVLASVAVPALPNASETPAPSAIPMTPDKPTAAAAMPITEKTVPVADPTAPVPADVPAQTDPLSPAASAAPVPAASVPAAKKGSIMHAKGITVNLMPFGKPDPLILTASQVDMVASADPFKTPSRALFSSDLKINGTTLLAGVTDADKLGNPWWSANGALLPMPVLDTRVHKTGGAFVDSGDLLPTKRLAFAFRLPPSTQGWTVEYEVPQSRGFSSDGFWPTKLRSNSGKTEAQAFADTQGCRVLTAEFPATLTRTNIRLGLASAQWKTVAAINAATNPSGLLHQEGNTKFLVSPLTDAIDLSVVPHAVMTVATDTADDVRVVAIDKEGREVLPESISGNSIGSLDQITVRFALPLAQIKEVRVEARPFQWVEIKDIALQPAHSVQAQSLQRSVATLPPLAEYGLVYFWLPDKSQPGRSHWRWVLQESGHPPYPPHGSGRLPHPVVEVKFLNDPLLTAYISRIPVGKSIGMAWQFKKSDLAHQAGLTGLQQLYARLKIGFHIDTWLSSYAENVK